MYSFLLSCPTCNNISETHPPFPWLLSCPFRRISKLCALYSSCIVASEVSWFRSSSLFVCKFKIWRCLSVSEKNNKTKGRGGREERRGRRRETQIVKCKITVTSVYLQHSCCFRSVAEKNKKDKRSKRVRKEGRETMRDSNRVIQNRRDIGGAPTLALFS